jgi:hypothetical protein
MPQKASAECISERTNERDPRREDVSALRRRRAAAWRLPPFNDAGHRDPLDILADIPAVVGPERFGLTTAETRAEANRLVSQCCWCIEEVVLVFGIEPRSWADVA